MDIVRRQFPATIVLVLGMALSAAGFFGTRHYFLSGERQEFDLQAAHYIQTVMNSTQRYEEHLQELARRFESPTPMDRWQFDEFSQEMLKRHPGLQSLVWIPRVEASRREEFEHSAQEDGLFGFQISETAADGSTRPAAPREYYFPIYYAVPFDMDRAFLGLDVYSLGNSGAALAAASEGGFPVVLPRPLHAAGDTPAARFNIAQPVYFTDEVADIGAPRKQRLMGFVAGELSLEAIANSIVGQLTTPAWLDIYIFRQFDSADTELLLFHPSRLRSDEIHPLDRDRMEEGLFSLSRFSLGDQQLVVAVKPVPGKYSFDSSVLPYWTGSIGLLLTFFLAHNMASTQSRARVIEQTVSERTAALSEANISLHNEILERQRAEMEMRRAKDEAEVANRSKSEFLAMVSHELRTPLNAIIGFSEMMSQEVFGKLGHEKYAGYVEDIGKSGTHLLGLINNILDLSKVEAGQYILREEEVSLGDGVADILRLLSELAESNGVRLETDMPHDLPALRADRQALRQILLNLLSNAIKFTEAAGRIRVAARIDPTGQLVLDIEDSGIGIPEESIERVFEPFTQVDSSLARQYEGTGLGLPLTRSLVELHDGSVDLESSIGKGTRVTVTFPKERVVGTMVH